MTAVSLWLHPGKDPQQGEQKSFLVISLVSEEDRTVSIRVIHPSYPSAPLYMKRGRRGFLGGWSNDCFKRALSSLSLLKFNCRVTSGFDFRWKTTQSIVQVSLGGKFTQQKLKIFAIGDRSSFGHVGMEVRSRSQKRSQEAYCFNCQVSRSQGCEC